MKLLLFLDDWFLDSKIDIVRIFSKAVPVSIPPETLCFGRCSIIYEEEKKRYFAIGKPLSLYSNPEIPPTLYTSTDGINWKKEKKKLKFRFSNQSKKKLSFSVGYPFEQGLFYDRWDKNSNRRYKMIIWPYTKSIEGGPGLIAYSSDGITWYINPKYKWYTHPNGSDTNNNIFYNPFTRRWCVICRKWNTDRRVAMVESEDLENWTEPRVILHPDALDKPLLQFYGMKAILYDDEYFIGIVQCFHVPMQEINEWSKGRIKMQGKVNTQLTYSYDGEYWLRSDRSTIIPRTEPGSYSYSCIYPHSIIDSPDKKKIYIYSIGTLQDHEKGCQIPSGYSSGEGLILHTLRRDGFAYLEPVGGWGQFTTRTLVPKSGKLTVNYQAPVGQVLVQVTDSKRKVIPGYSFKDCVPLQGDEIYCKVIWKTRKDLSELVNKPIHLEFRLFDARIYAVRLDFGLWYTNTPEPIERI